MILFRAYIENKAVTNRVYWAGSEDAEVVALKKQITDVAVHQITKTVVKYKTVYL